MLSPNQKHTKMKKSLSHFQAFASFFCFFLLLPELQAQISFSTNTSYSYLKGGEADSLGTDWASPDFDHTSWPKGNAPFRYGDGTGGTVLADMQYSYSTLYLRTTFNASNVDKLGDVSFTIDYDDGFVIWINGQEILKKNAPENMSPSSFATINHESGTPEVFTVNVADIPLQESENTIAVQCFNVNLESSDLFFDMAVEAEVVLPEMVDTVELSFSHSAGFYNTPFDLVINSSDPESQILYTLDGSNPQTSSSVDTAGSTATIHVDPERATGKATTPAFLIRASVKKQGYKPSIPETKTFVFIEQVKTQTFPGGKWPQGYVNDKLIDLEVDAKVVEDPRYAHLIDDALLDIPSISVVTDLENLFDSLTGIYTNTYNRGDEWEKASSVELLNPNGTIGFQVNAGLRIRGAYSRRHDNPKHSFRLLFRKKYGDGKLHFPLFGDEGVAEYDRLDLRTAQNYSWNEGSQQNTFVRDVFSRDTQRDMGQPYTRSRYYHLYLNGMYWGIYQTQERAEAFFAESYFGDKQEDYDIIKVTSENGRYVEATDGDMSNWERIYNLTKQGFSDNADYFQLEGKNAEGKPIKGSEVLVDIDNLIDYMLVIFYTGNFDGPTSKFGKNKGANNFYALFNHSDKNKGFQFLAHDSEHSLLSRSENRVNIGSLAGEYKMEVWNLRDFHPQWLHFKLSENAEYRRRFADRAYKHLVENGALTPEKALARLNKRVSELDTAIIAESARWGDVVTNYALNKIDHWLPEINYIRDHYVRSRTGTVINQLEEEGLFSSLKPPFVKVEGEAVGSATFTLDAPISVYFEKQEERGDVFYTFNGEDPRSMGGGIAESAEKLLAENEALEIGASAILKARVYNSGDWSPLRELSFLATKEDFTHLKVTELHYHPLDIIEGKDTLFGKDYEFLELKNTGEHAINLTGLALSGAVTYNFPDKGLLAPGEFFVITSKPSKFYEIYGRAASGNFQGNLSNSGETLVLKDAAGSIVFEFSYMDDSPWPEDADGEGNSLVSSDCNPAGQPQEISYWKSSRLKGGSPFKDDKEEVLSILELKPEETFKIFPNPTGGKIHIFLNPDQEKAGAEFLVEIYSPGGRKVYQKMIRNKAYINLKALGIKGGLYLLKAHSGSRVEITKFIYIPSFK